MFERYSERARRALFFARYAVTQHGGDTIEAEHLLLGVIHTSPEALLRFTGGAESVQALRARLEAACAQPHKLPDRAEIPFSFEAKAALERTPSEADDLKNRWILPEHIVLGVMVNTAGAAAGALRDAGIEPDAIRDYLRYKPDDPADDPGAHAPPRVARQWKGVVKPGLADRYITHLHQETFPSLRGTAEFVYATIMRRDLEDGTEFLVTTYWRSLDAIKAFAGEDVTKAVVPPAAQALMVRYDDRAVHYDIVQ